MQALQAQTTEAHKKFLETQSEAGRSLQRMMESIRQISEVALGIAPQHPHLPDTIASPTRSETGSASTDSLPLETEIQTELSTDARRRRQAQKAPPSLPDAPRNEPQQRVHAPLPAAGQAGEAETNAAPDTQAPSRALAKARYYTLSAISPGIPYRCSTCTWISNQTWVSTPSNGLKFCRPSKKNCPILPAISPEIMGSLKTLAQIVDALDGTSPSIGVEHDPADKTSQDPDPVRHPPEDTTVHVRTLMIEIVSDLTGYPARHAGSGHGYRGGSGHRLHQAGRNTFHPRRPTAGAPPGDAGHHGRPEDPRTDMRLPDITFRQNRYWASTRQSGLLTPAPVDSDTGKDPSPRPASCAFSDIERHSVTVKNRPLSQVNLKPYRPTNAYTLSVGFSGLGKALVDTFAAHDIQASHMPFSKVSSILDGSHDISNAAGLVILPDSHPGDDQADDTYSQ